MAEEVAELRDGWFTKNLESGVRFIADGVVVAQKIVSPLAGGSAFENWIGRAAEEGRGSNEYGNECQRRKHSHPTFHGSNLPLIGIDAISIILIGS
jgi:hypothetical protein